MCGRMRASVAVRNDATLQSQVPKLVKRQNLGRIKWALALLALYRWPGDASRGAPASVSAGEKCSHT